MNLESLIEQKDIYLNQVVEIKDAYLVVDIFGNCFLYPESFEMDLCKHFGVTIDFENLEERLSNCVGSWVGGKIAYHNKVDISGTVVRGTTKQQPLRLTQITKLIVYNEEDERIEII